MSKVPARRYQSDDLTIASGGETYHPHEGEWVEMRGGPSWDFMRQAAVITQLESRPFNVMTSEESQDMTRALGSVTAFLASRLVAWSWTDMDGKPLSEPTAEVIGTLDQQEVLWLIQTLIAGAPPAQAEESEKNA